MPCCWNAGCASFGLPSWLSHVDRSYPKARGSCCAVDGSLCKLIGSRRSTGHTKPCLKAGGFVETKRDMKEQLATFIKTELMRNPDYPLQNDEPLITGGLVDSFSLVELALFIEEQFGVHFDDVELTAQNMNTIDQIVGNIEAKL